MNLFEQQADMLKTARHWQDLLPAKANEFKELTIADFKNISGECLNIQNVEAKRALNRISAQIKLAKLEGAIK